MYMATLNIQNVKYGLHLTCYYESSYMLMTDTDMLMTDMSARLLRLVNY